MTSQEFEYYGEMDVELVRGYPYNDSSNVQLRPLPLKILVKKHDENLPSIVKDPRGDWLDLCNAEEVRLHAGDYAEISMGVSIELPPGYEAYIAPRSSTFKKFGILQTDSGGVIDNSFKGNDDIWHMSVYATRDVVIPQYTRIAQFRITLSMPSINIREVEELTNPNRGGYGATDIPLG